MPSRALNAAILAILPDGPVRDALAREMANDVAGEKQDRGTKRGPEPPAIMIDVSGVAAMLGCSVRHVKKMDSSGRLPQGVKLGRCKRWHLPTLEAWAAEKCPPRAKFEAMQAGKPTLRIAK